MAYSIKAERDDRFMVYSRVHSLDEFFNRYPYAKIWTINEVDVKKHNITKLNFKKISWMNGLPYEKKETKCQEEN